MDLFEFALYAGLAVAFLFLVFLVVFAIIEGSMSRKADAKIRAYKTKGQL